MSISIVNNIPAQRAVRTLESNLAGVGAAAGALATGERLQEPTEEVTDTVELSSDSEETLVSSASVVTSIESEPSQTGRVLDLLG